jgi:hypothetical protein
MAGACRLLAPNRYPAISHPEFVIGRKADSRGVTFLTHNGIFVEEKAMIGREIATKVYV